MIYILVSLFFSSYFFIMSMQSTEDVKTESFLLKQMQDYKKAENAIENKKKNHVFKRMTQLKRNHSKTDKAHKTPQHRHKVNLKVLFEKNKHFYAFLVEWIDFTYQKHFTRKLGKVFVEAILNYYDNLSANKKQMFTLRQFMNVKFKNAEDKKDFLRMLKGSRALHYASFFDLFTLNNDTPPVYFYHCPEDVLAWFFSEDQLKIVKEEHERFFKKKENRWNIHDCIQHVKPNALQKQKLSFFSFELNSSSKKEVVVLKTELPLKREL